MKIKILEIPLTNQDIKFVLENSPHFKAIHTEDVAGISPVAPNSAAISEPFKFALLERTPGVVIKSEYNQSLASATGNNDSGEDIIWFDSKPPYLNITEVKAGGFDRSTRVESQKDMAWVLDRIKNASKIGENNTKKISIVRSKSFIKDGREMQINDEINSVLKGIKTKSIPGKHINFAIFGDINLVDTSIKNVDAIKNYNSDEVKVEVYNRDSTSPIAFDFSKKEEDDE